MSLYFWVCSSRIRGQNWVWSSRKSNMALNLEKSNKKSGMFFISWFFFEPKEYWDLILTMINGDRNSWTTRKNLSHRSQIAIPFARWQISNMSDMSFWKTTQLPQNSVLKSFRGGWLWVWHRIFGIQNGGPNTVDIIFWNANGFRGTLYSKVFEVADYEFDIGFSEFKITDPIWWTWNFGNSTIFA